MPNCGVVQQCCIKGLYHRNLFWVTSPKMADVTPPRLKVILRNTRETLEIFFEPCDRHQKQVYSAHAL